MEISREVLRRLGESLKGRRAVEVNLEAFDQNTHQEGPTFMVDIRRREGRLKVGVFPQQPVELRGTLAVVGVGFSGETTHYEQSVALERVRITSEGAAAVILNPQGPKPDGLPFNWEGYLGPIMVIADSIKGAQASDEIKFDGGATTLEASLLAVRRRGEEKGDVGLGFQLNIRLPPDRTQLTRKGSIAVYGVGAGWLMAGFPGGQIKAIVGDKGDITTVDFEVEAVRRSVGLRGMLVAGTGVWEAEAGSSSWRENVKTQIYFPPDTRVHSIASEALAVVRADSMGELMRRIFGE